MGQYEFDLYRFCASAHSDGRNGHHGNNLYCNGERTADRQRDLYGNGEYD